jgi:multidrug resistance efflux pump
MQDLAHTLRRNVLPWVLWLGLVVGAYFAWRGMGSGLAVRGFAEGIPYRLASVEPARVESVLVKVGDRVRAGQVVAVLDARAIDGEMRAAEAEKARVIAEIAKAGVEAKATRVDMVRGLSGGKADAERSVREATTRLETARAELKAVKSELAKRKVGVAAGVVRAPDLAELEIRVAALTRNIAEEERAVKVYEAQSQSAEDLGAPAEDSWVQAATAPLEAEIKVYERQLRTLEARRDRYILRAPADGQVSVIYGQPDSVVGPNLPLIEIMPDSPGRIVACLAEDVHAPVSVGAVATARPWAARDRALPGKAISVGPVTELPLRCRRDAQTPIWGRLVTVELNPPAMVVPGESFEVRFEPDGG